MTEGYASDVRGDDTVMDSPHVTVTIDLSQVPAQQALAIANEAGLDQQDAWIVGEMVKNDNVPCEVNDAEFHLPLGVGLTVLSEANVVDLPSDPEQLEDNNE